MPCRTEGSGSPCMFHDLAIITVTGELDLALCVELTRELNAAPALLSASDRHRPRGRLLGGLIGNRAAAQRHSAPRSHRTPARDCLPTRIAAPRFRAHRPRSPAADARDPSRRTGCRRRQLIGGPPIRVRRTRRACLATRTPSCSPWVCDSLTKCQTQAAVTASHDPAQEGQPLVTGLQAARCPTSDRGTHELSRRGRRSPLNARRDVDALRQVEASEEPGDLRGALDAQPVARENWDAFPRSTRRAIGEWIQAAKRPETRSRRIVDTVEKAAVNVRANPWRDRSRNGAR